jgi:hypothetical protein
MVLFTTGLALAAVLLLNYFAGLPGIRSRIRWDMTLDSRNTLSASTEGVLRNLRDKVEIDVFFRGEEAPLTRVAVKAMELVTDQIQLMDVLGGSLINVKSHNPNDTEAIAARLQELRLSGYENCIVVSSGEQRDVLSLRGEIAEFDPGRPSQAGYVPPSIVAYKGEQALLQGILKVTLRERPKLYFTTGHGERDLLELDQRSIGKLHTALVADGFEASRWNLVADGALPDDCAALAIIGPDTAFSAEELEAIHAYVGNGGRLIISAHEDVAALERSSVDELITPYNLTIYPGHVLTPFVNSLGQATVASEQCASFYVIPEGMAVHPITTPLRLNNRSIRFSFTHALGVPGEIEGGIARTLIASHPQSWVDVGLADYIPDGETAQSFVLATVSTFTPSEEAGVVGPLQLKKESRIFLTGGSDVFSNGSLRHNADFLRNIFNWATDREYRVKVSPMAREERMLRIGEDDSVAKLFRATVWYLPGLCLAAGILTAFLRSRGGPRQGSTS